MGTVRVMIALVVVGAVLLVSIVVIVIEARVMRKPQAERSEREQRFLRADRAVARGYQTYGRSVAPWVAVGGAVLGLLVTIPFWLEGRVGPALGLTVLFVVLGGGMLLFWSTVLRHRGPGSAWRQREDERTAEADAAGRPRWFVSVKAGWWLSAAMTAFGLVFLVTPMATGGEVPVAGIIVTTVGLLFLVLTVVQQRAEARR